MARGKDTEPSPGRRGKSHLPEKLCIACNRPFAWRKKWARDWEQVRYCSDRCRSAGDRNGPKPQR
ncbi:MAG TPA: DUF2256 domain-containing protein [Alphaproteobacteria bacterium]|nr:DUF2256 domain-containing protein [Alphaproteobacteria bacterium]HAJ47838.1 DUF2256 domain-containing protein [Alphaproteobacteria bacterium]